MQIALRRHLRQNGRCRPRPPPVARFCQQEGHLILAHLCESEPTSLSDLIEGCQAQLLETPDCLPHPMRQPTYLCAVLTRLLEMDVVRLESIQST